MMKTGIIAYKSYDEHSHKLHNCHTPSTNTIGIPVAYSRKPHYCKNSVVYSG